MKHLVSIRATMRPDSDYEETYHVRTTLPTEIERQTGVTSWAGGVAFTTPMEFDVEWEVESQEEGLRIVGIACAYLLTLGFTVESGSRTLITDGKHPKRWRLGDRMIARIDLASVPEANRSLTSYRR